MKKLEELSKIYGTLPRIECKGLCGERFCNVIGLGKVEEFLVRTYLAKQGREFIPFHTHEEKRVKLALADAIFLDFPQSFEDPKLRCPYLTGEAKCSIYEARPLICRLWGMTPTMTCPYGCKPEVTLTDELAKGLLQVAADL